MGGGVKVRAAAAGGFVPDMNRRNIMNLLLVGAAGLPATTMLGAYAFFFVPQGSGGGGAGLTAKDALGNDVTSKSWLASHGVGDHSLTQGLKGDPTYLVVTEDNKNGRVIRGPAPLSLALAHADVDGDSDSVVFTPWTETDFRTGLQPWWK